MVRGMIRCALLSISMAGLLSIVAAQVMETTRLTSELRRARTLMAGATATDLPHHVHYDLSFKDRHGHRQSGTLDIYRDPLRYIRIDIASGNYRYTNISDLLHKRDWTHFNDDMPLKIYDLRGVLLEPEPAASILEHASPPPTVQQEMIEGSPYACAGNGRGIRICFDPLIRSFAFAQVFNQTVAYDDWQNIGTHAVPGRIRIFDGKNVLIEATGRVEAVKRFSPLLFQPGSEPTQSEEGAHKLLHAGQADPVEFYGTVQLKILVDEKGKVKKATVLDSDDKRVEHTAVEFARSLRFAPEQKNGAPAPFSWVFYMRAIPPG